MKIAIHVATTLLSVAVGATADAQSISPDKPASLPSTLGLAETTKASIGIPAVNLTHDSYVFDSAEQHRIRVVVVARGLKHPFSVALLPNGDALVSERSRSLRLVHNVAGGGPGVSQLDSVPVSGIPKFVPYYAHGGLHDIALHPNFANNRLVYFTFNRPGKPPPADAKPPIRRESILTVFRGRLSESGLALTDVREVFAANAGGTSSGSRIAFGKDGLIHVTTGSPFDDAPQRLDTDYGKTLRIRDDGTIPSDNPFVAQPGARPEIFTYGHRDQLGLAVQPETGSVVAAEFGPNGGDEINLILAGKNYGWPIVSFGRQYEGPRWSATPCAADTELPIVVWLPSISPFGLAFYSGDKFPEWKGNLFAGSVQRGEILHTGGLERIVFNSHLEEIRRESLLTDLHQRIGDVRMGPDGLLYLLTDEDDGALLRLEPAN